MLLQIDKGKARVAENKKNASGQFTTERHFGGLIDPETETDPVLKGIAEVVKANYVEPEAVEEK